MALSKTSNKARRISILNGLPLALWYSGEKEEAWKIVDQAVAEFPEEPSILNTQGILYRNAKDYDKALLIFSQAYNIGVERGDLGSAAHAANNRGGILEVKGNKNGARLAYEEALELYKKAEKDPRVSAAFHITGVMRKLRLLNTTPWPISLIVSAAYRLRR